MTPSQILAAARPYSLFLSRLLDNHLLDQDKLYPWLQRRLTADDFHDFADWRQLQVSENEAELARQLRLLRRYVMAHIMARDLARVSDLAEVTTTITHLADFAINVAEQYVHAYYAGLYGEPIGYHSATPQRLSVVGMGKMGGYELNVSSDIDLIFVFPEAGDTNGKRQKSNQEFFTKVGQKIIALLNDITGDGQVFRVDMRLRPDGDAGALVINETALEQYLIQHGREWERYAWTKARLITDYPNNIATLVRPFVYRKYLDFNAYDAMRSLHQQIQREVTRKGMADNIKLGAGGIREVEFVAQIFQLIRGGQVRSLQLKGTQETLQTLLQQGMLTQDNVDTLLQAYHFLRDTEHRLQYWDDQQTQMLPTGAEQQQMLAQSMGYGNYADYLAALNQHREAVNQIFNAIFIDPDDKAKPQNPDMVRVWQDESDCEEKTALLATYGFDAKKVLPRLQQLHHGSQYRQLSPAAQQRFDEMIPSVLSVAAKYAQPDTTLTRLLDFLEAIGRRSSYLAFMHEHPEALEKLAGLMSQSSWVATYLQQHPVLLDELLSNELMRIDTDWAAHAQELVRVLDDCHGDVETQMDVLRRFQHAWTFRLAVQDLAGLWTVEALSDQLSALADLIIETALARVWAQLPRRHTDTPHFAVIGYGKLGGKELGYTSDLDLVYVFADDHPDAIDIYTRLARRLTSWLTVPTGAGMLYDIDLRLRPNGDSGFTVTHIQAFERYQRESAWIWEHQALTRARFIGGDSTVGTRFDAVRDEILCRQRDTDELRTEIIAMREKMFPTHPPVDSNVKYARGGVVDVEFIVQYLILAYAHQYPQLLQNYGNIALLSIAAELGLVDSSLAEGGRAAYRYYRQQQHNTRLRDAVTTPIDATLLAHYQVVKQLWTQVFAAVPTE
ncbi:bifunctional [glutamate--ammonia ligase]-adenylyl-L-tyrosine phosphorylase/[glutamate--ammonia-ligase] adenylyltransferase [Snodgrassella alvi]|uniref:bifunctional [glutamate--ammonia ligase]-adenylyl-L-tyrosine phosphorylase/[glutamate--ammonia-ligase] adenylyltransferase n=1 Tax=Snodgrassella alvi TaxID=1196083 RepID=UPI000C1EE0C0|nr:bifunctional [glutamate--ammonia ligase]-adenylyl-L-tyrosine phosphorylase/[glutamate--ammonia-ligase] adenylyltransferase [Snodgrassella alvi]PIT13436.1 bifunctional glutamine synthetase adenylyltransferase/deadenyltransferase [Snodgrassella alvi]PIT15724.1 bifunctional glutamine synthetase adenylyltransferase/deadenyltransferase [Snodgrassella alvi]